MLRTLAAEAGIDPEMTVLDQLAADRRFDERWRAALERVDADGPDGAALDRALSRGLTLKGLRELAVALMEREDVAAWILANPPTPPPPRWEEIAPLRDRLTALPLETVAEDDACLRHIEDLLDLIDATAPTDGWERDAALAGAGPLCAKKLSKTGNRPNWRGDVAALERARAEAAAAGAVIGEVLAASRAEAVAGILPWLAQVVIDDAAARRRDGTLVFNDLILWTRDLLRDDPSARAQLRARFDALLIDEFQDTDPWQVDIAESFAQAADGSLEPGRLFLVGDPKQSIYRFRRADMAIYAAERARVLDAGRRCSRASPRTGARAA